jgi:uncharacterized membrane protein (DUF4010 family)
MTAANLSALDLAGRLALIGALAVFLGLSFEEVYKRDHHANPGGVRTFPLLAVCGAMLYLIEPQHALAFIAGLLVIGMWLQAYIRRAQEDGSAAGTLMIPASNLIAFLIGPIGLTQPPWLVVAIAVAAVLLLGTRERLHQLITLIPPDETVTAGQFLVLVGVILPLVPDQAVTTLTPLTPYKVWLAVVAICTLSYASYLLQRYAPARDATLLPAVLGGLYSSTAATIALAKRARETGGGDDLAAGIVVATAVMYLRLGVVVALFNVQFALALAPALAGLFAVGAAMSAYEWRRASATIADKNLSVPAANPLQIPTAVVFALIFVVISVVSSWAQASFGRQGVFALAFLVGVTDIDPFVINVAQGGVANLSIGSISAAFLIAASSNNVVKAIYAVAFGGVKAARRPAVMLLLLAACGFAAAAGYLVWPASR